MVSDNRRRSPVTLRLVAQGTRVVVLRGEPPHVAGTVAEVRLEPHLKTYVVNCDNGTVVFASGYDLAREDDSGVTPLGPRPEF